VNIAGVGAFLWLHYQKSWVDVGTIVVALCYTLYRAYRTGFRMKLRDAGRQAMDGAAVFPLFLLALTVFSRHILEALMASSRGTLSIAGLFALFAILSDDDSGEKTG